MDRSDEHPTERRRLRDLAGWLAVAFLPALVGAPFPAPEWYRSLRKPVWAPPAAVFAPVWSVLYISIGVAPWLATRRGPLPRPTAALYATQLALNAAWTPIFFGARRPFAALVTIIATWVAILATAVAFWRRRPFAGAVLVPYLAWTTFATALSAAIWQRNRQAS